MRCGGRSIESFFNNYRHHRQILQNVDHRPLTYWEKEYPQEYKTYFKWGTVRNPWAMKVSRYFGGINNSKKAKKYGWNKETFRQHIKKRCTDLKDNNNVYKRYFLNSKGKMGLDFVAKIENIEEDFNTVCDKIGIRRQKLPHIGNTQKKRKPYWHYYDEETADLVYQNHREVIDLYGYEFGK